MASFKLGVVGLGRMGANIAYRAVKAGYDVVGFDFSDAAREQARLDGVQELVATVQEVAKHARVIWLMVPAGDPVDAVIKDLLPQLQAGDIIIDGGNSHFPDSIRRAHMLAQHNIFFLDCGTSGGLHGRDIGFSLMVGGDTTAYARVAPLLAKLAAPNGVGHVGPCGAGHYVKMVHNGIEYGLLQAYGEGFELLKEGTFKKDALNLEEISRIWSGGSIIRSWILDLAHAVFKRDQELKNISGAIQESGTGRWTVDEAHDNNIPVPVIEKSLEVRAWSRESGGNYATKVVAMLRHEFGGHAVKKLE